MQHVQIQTTAVAYNFPEKRTKQVGVQLFENIVPLSYCKFTLESFETRSSKGLRSGFDGTPPLCTGSG